MNIKIEEVINLVKSNGVKRFKFKDNKSELELDFTEVINHLMCLQTKT